MGKIFQSISPELNTWLAQQKMFFVATAPLSAGGHVNCSPKGGDTFRVLGPREVGYVDLTGSGVETIAHLQENGRIVVMACAFEGAPRIVRLHGQGEVVYPHDPRFTLLAFQFTCPPGIRAIIRIEVQRISDSCGFGVPFYDFVEERDTLHRWTEKRSEVDLKTYREEKNAQSIDGIIGYKPDQL